MLTSTPSTSPAPIRLIVSWDLISCDFLTRLAPTGLADFLHKSISFLYLW